MKKLFVFSVFLLGMVGTASAQSMSGGLNFNLSISDESWGVDRAGFEISKLASKTRPFTGSIYMDFSTGGDYPNIAIEGTLNDRGDMISISIECPNTHVIAISSRSNNTKGTVNDKFQLLAYCVFSASSPDGTAEGFASLNLAGKLTRPKGADPDALPSNISLSGSTLSGGGINGEGDAFIFKGTFKSVMGPEIK